MKIRYGIESDIQNWMELVNQVKDLFPGLDTKEQLDEHKKTVLDFMKRKEALCAVEDDKILGILLFSKKERMICFLAVDSHCRRKKIGESLVNTMLEIIPNRSISVRTFTENQREGKPARAFYKSLGFKEKRYVKEYGEMVQEFVLERLNSLNDWMRY